MDEFAKSVNKFLEFREYKILPDKCKGKISMDTAKDKATAEYEKFNKKQKIISDFDKAVKGLTKKQLNS